MCWNQRRADPRRWFRHDVEADVDLVADGLVLIFVAGTWYLLATLITGKKLFMQNIARAALAVELIVSWTVWSHHLLSDQSQPAFLKIVSGELVTAFELITQVLRLSE